MKHRTTLILVAVIIVNVVALAGLINWRAQKVRQAEIMLRDATRYAGVTGDTITAFDERTNRWLAELREESIEETLQKLTGATEYVAGLALSRSSGFGFGLQDEEGREIKYYRAVIDVILSNRRFRKAYEDLQKTNRRQAAKLLTSNIRDNLAALRIMLQEDREKVAGGEHTGDTWTVLSISVEDAYRPMSRFDIPPTRMGRKYAVLSYILLASFLEIREVRPAVEEVIQFAKEEYEFFNTMDFGNETFSFQSGVLRQSLYNPSLLVTATFCDPSWKVAEKRRLPADKLVVREVVDYQARAIEQDKDARQGLLPVVPHDGMLKIRYYQGITDAEFNEFFGN